MSRAHFLFFDMFSTLIQKASVCNSWLVVDNEWMLLALPRLQGLKFSQRFVPLHRQDQTGRFRSSTFVILAGTDT